MLYANGLQLKGMNFKIIACLDRSMSLGIDHPSAELISLDIKAVIGPLWVNEIADRLRTVDHSFPASYAELRHADSLLLASTQEAPLIRHQMKLS